MRALGLAAAGLLMAAGAAAADGVTLPDVSGLDRKAAEALIAELAQVNVMTSNCPAWAIDDGAWALLTGTGDKLAAQLGMDPAAYDDRFYGPAFALLDDPGACDRVGPKAAPLIARLEAMGGSTGPARTAAKTGAGHPQAADAAAVPGAPDDETTPEGEAGN